MSPHSTGRSGKASDSEETAGLRHPRASSRRLDRVSRDGSRAACSACRSVSASTTRGRPASPSCRRERRPTPIPSFAHSSSRRSDCAAGAQPAGQADLAEKREQALVTGARSSRDDATASSTPRSAPGSSSRRPPATFANTSAAPRRARRRASRAPRGASRGASRRSRCRHALRRGEARGGDERLDLDEERPRAFDRRRPRWPRRGRGLPSPRKAPRRVGDLAQAVLGHLEHAELVGRAEAILRRAQDAHVVVALAFEVEHGVDHVLEHARAGDRAILRDVSDEEQRARRPPSRGRGSGAARTRAPASPNRPPCRRPRR